MEGLSVCLSEPLCRHRRQQPRDQLGVSFGSPAEEMLLCTHQNLGEGELGGRCQAEPLDVTFS